MCDDDDDFWLFGFVAVSLTGGGEVFWCFLFGRFSLVMVLGFGKAWCFGVWFLSGMVHHTHDDR